MCARTDITFYFSYRLKGSDNYQQFEKATDLERFDLFFKRLCEVKELGEVKDLKKMLEAVLGTAPTVRTSVLASRSQRADIRQLVQQYFSMNL
ncbi:MAG TPA: hypothetical protein VNA15_05395 [Candidatus Angelobacter sp.]|nr:hypothetical protein [Candidatus Angelobacter sp.]